MMKSGVIILLISSSFLVTACNSGTASTPAAEHGAQFNKDEIVLPPSEQGAGIIQTQAAALSEEPDTLRVAGRIALADDRTWRVGVLTEGRVEVVYAGLGDYVQKGQVLARMHSHELHEARAQYQTSLSDLSRLQAAAALAQKNYDRMQTLLGLKAASIQQTEQARQELLNAQTALHDGQIAADRDRIHLEDNLGVPADLPPGGHDENADLIPIVAPGSGYILDKKVTPGTTVQPSTDTFVIGELSQVWMLASVRQENLADLRVGQPATVTLPGVPGERFPGKITNLGQELDQTTRVMKVRIVLNNPGMKLKPEMLANAEIPVGKQADAARALGRHPADQRPGRHLCTDCGRPLRDSSRPYRRNGRRQDPGLRRAEARGTGRGPGKLCLEVAALKVLHGKPVGVAMLNRIIDFTLAYRWLVLVGILALLAVGGYALYTIPVEAFPDLTNNQVVVVTDAPSLPPSEVEQLVTYPIERAMLGLPNKQEVRSLSKLGLSMVTVVFDDAVPMYFARQLVSERLQQISSLLPQGIQPVLGLPSTAFGELYQYTLSGPMSPMELKDLHEWVIKGQLRTIPGVSEINAWGGQTKQFQVIVDPALLEQYGLTLHDVATRIEENNTNFGGGYIEHASEQYTIRGTGRAVNTEDFGNIVLTAKDGTPVLIRDVAEVKIGAAPPQGATPTKWRDRIGHGDHAQGRERQTSN